jgi:hypothetical protein
MATLPGRQCEDVVSGCRREQEGTATHKQAQASLLDREPRARNPQAHCERMMLIRARTREVMFRMACHQPDRHCHKKKQRRERDGTALAAVAR